MKENDKTVAIIVAGGSGSRMGSDIPKQFLSYRGKTVLEWAVTPFLISKEVDEVVLVIPDHHREEFNRIYGRLSEISAKPIGVTIGGNSRQESVKKGLEFIQGSDECIVLIHDGARPNISLDVIEENIETVRKYDASVTVVETTDTTRIISDKSLKNERIYPIMRSETLPREMLYNVQTPQGFKKRVIDEAIKYAEANDIKGTDDAMLADMIGIHPVMVKGTHQNIKITRKEDLPSEISVGNGFDVHGFESGRKLILCGVEIPNDKGLKGHSDADVAVHALMDALLGATGNGDIGRHFPDNDEKFKDADSLELLVKVKDIISCAKISNIDVTIMAERPKLSLYMEDMRKNLSKTLDIPISSVNVKATTTEGLGFIGREEGIAALATCTVIK